MGDNWETLPIELVSVIALKLDYLESFMSLAAVCKSWNSAASDESMENVKLCLPTKYPWLFLAEDVGLDLSSVKVSEDEASPSKVDDVDNENHNLFKNISATRGLYSLATQKNYHLQVPEATDRLILGTNKGWLVTLGKDLEINLLHPLLRHQIPLPPMLAFPSQYVYDDDFPPQKIYTLFVSKVVMSSKVQTYTDTNNLPIVMAIYGEFKTLSFSRLGDKLWTDVETSERCFDDIVYHKEKFYAVDCRGAVWAVFLCKDDKRETNKGIKITSIPLEVRMVTSIYLIESLTGSHVWLALRFRERGKSPGNLRYYTNNFLVCKLEIQYNNTDVIPSCTWNTNIKDLGNEALFIGLNSSVSIASSEFIKPNSIYFTDDATESIHDKAGGHDMGIFDVETGTIKPHFQGTSIHHFSPSVWYI